MHWRLKHYSVRQVKHLTSIIESSWAARIDHPGMQRSPHYNVQHAPRAAFHLHQASQVCQTTFNWYLCCIVWVMKKILDFDCTKFCNHILCEKNILGVFFFMALHCKRWLGFSLARNSDKWGVGPSHIRKCQYVLLWETYFQKQLPPPWAICKVTHAICWFLFLLHFVANYLTISALCQINVQTRSLMTWNCNDYNFLLLVWHSIPLFTPSLSNLSEFSPDFSALTW